MHHNPVRGYVNWLWSLVGLKPSHGACWSGLTLLFTPRPESDNGLWMVRQYHRRVGSTPIYGKSERGLGFADPSPEGERSARASGKSGAARSDRRETSGGAVAVLCCTCTLLRLITECCAVAVADAVRTLHLCAAMVRGVDEWVFSRSTGCLGVRI